MATHVTRSGSDKLKHTADHETTSSSSSWENNNSQAHSEAKDESGHKRQKSVTASRPLGGSVETTVFGQLEDGNAVQLFTLKNSHGSVAKIIDFGATVTELHVADRTGRLSDVVLGYGDIKGYLANAPHMGAICGRVGNRIGNARFTLDGKEYKFEANNGPNLLHGGTKGFHKKLWNAKVQKSAEPSVLFTLVSPDGDSGFPGELKCEVRYTLSDQNEFIIDMVATTDKPTVVNLVSHGYWNLSGHETGDCLKHNLLLNADLYTPNDDTQVPTGEIKSLRGTCLDFTESKPIGRDIGALKDDKPTGGGYDHNFVLRTDASQTHPHSPLRLRLAADVHDPVSGRRMELLTSDPGVQLYTANWLSDEPGKGGVFYKKHQGFCLETQKFPDAPNKPHFPSAVLRPGETYRHVMVHRFSAV